MSAPTIARMAARAEALHTLAMDLLCDLSAAELNHEKIFIDAISNAVDGLEFIAAHLVTVTGGPK